MEQTLFSSNRYLRYIKKGNEIKFISKICYHYILCYRMLRNNTKWLQTPNINREVTWYSVVTIYLIPTEITYDQVSECIGNKFRKSIIEEECGIIYKPRSSVNPTSKVILEWIHQVLGNLVRNYNIKEAYIYKFDLWLGILTAAAFKKFATEIS